MLREILRWSVGVLALFGSANLVRAGLGGADHNVWWVDLRWLPSAIGGCVLAGCCIAIVAGVVIPHSRRARAGAVVACAVLAVIGVVNAVTFWMLLSRGVIASDVPVPLSILFAAILWGGAWAHARPPSVVGARRVLAAVPALMLAGAFPLLQSLTFGLTNYARPAEAIVVFGARVYADGTPSDALSDRVREGVRLYHAGLAPRVVMSGGPGDGAISEPEAMQRLAESLGVPCAAITQDRSGLNTAATIGACKDLGLSRVVAVSHFYHLPRVKLLAEHQGVTAYTAPSPQGRALRALPVFMGREVAAWWWYYVC
ncbi:MAG TPA: YdcF family protein [Phycisphaerales bacterium]|nr:YdcF family protein [Phycisphaerales bacterium]